MDSTVTGLYSLRLPAEAFQFAPPGASESAEYHAIAVASITDPAETWTEKSAPSNLELPAVAILVGDHMG